MDSGNNRFLKNGHQEKVVITIEGQLYSSKNSRQIFKNKATGHFYPVKSKRAMANQDSLKWKLADARKKFEWQRMMVAVGSRAPHRVQFKIFRRDKQPADYVNLIQQLLDCMVEQGYLEDDDMNNLIPVFVPYEVDPKHPRVEIEILPQPKTEAV